MSNTRKTGTGPSDHRELRERFTAHLAANVAVGAGLAAASLLVGMAGYHWLSPMSWVDAFVNAAMLLGGMGPVAPLENTTLKVFAGVYALYCGVVLLAIVGLVLTPIGTYVLHRFHLDRER